MPKPVPAARLAHRIRPGHDVRLDSFDPDSTGPFDGKDDPRAIEQLRGDLERLADFQQRLYAEERQSLLVVLQAPDGAGKDGVLRKVVGPLDSRGVHVWNFRAPCTEELAHDFLWRCHAKTPARGEIAFWNRSHYEDVLVVRVLGLVPEAVWRRRYEHINAFERLLEGSGTRVVKLFLHISKDEQKKRFQDRLRDPEKRWKFDPRDLETRARWADYRRAYEEAIARCTHRHAPWWVVPANQKWYRDLCVARVLAEALEEMDPRYPKPRLDPRRIVIR